MLEPASSLVAGFNRQLKVIGEAKHRQLRCIWGERDLGVERWVIQCHLPDDIHGQCLQDFETFHEDRFVEKDIVSPAGQVVGHFRFDQVNPWALIHVVQDSFYDMDDPRGYRLPDERDTGVIWNWMHEFDTVAQQMRAVRDENRKADEAHERERVACLARDIKDSRSLWEDPELMYVTTKEAMAGTEIGNG